MGSLRCKMCGEELRTEDGAGVCVCEYCGSVQTIPVSGDERVLRLFDRANRLRSGGEFDRAEKAYEDLTGQYPEEAEGYWGKILCRNGVIYVDAAGGKRVPVCYRGSLENVFTGPDFEMIMENSEGDAKRVYREQAKEIEEIRREIAEVAARMQPYDVFISCRETADNGERTRESVLAQEAYAVLSARGYRVFSGRNCLVSTPGIGYEPCIFSALNSSRVMLAFGTSYDNFNTIPVKNEWSRFLRMLAKDQSRFLIPCISGIDEYDIPKEFSGLRVCDMDHEGAAASLVQAVDRVLGSGQRAAAGPMHVFGQMNVQAAQQYSQQFSQQAPQQYSQQYSQQYPQRTAQPYPRQGARQYPQQGAPQTADEMVKDMFMQFKAGAEAMGREELRDLKTQFGEIRKGWTQALGQAAKAKDNGARSVMNGIFKRPARDQVGLQSQEQVRLHPQDQIWQQPQEQVRLHPQEQVWPQAQAPVRGLEKLFGKKSLPSDQGRQDTGKQIPVQYPYLLNATGVKTGDIVTLGRFETGSGVRPIRWRVLDDSSGYLLIADQAVDCMPFHDQQADVAWEDSALRRWLNEIFYITAFSEDEREYIADSTASVSGAGYGTDSGRGTADHLYLLSVEEAEKYFRSDADRRCLPTQRVIRKGAVVVPGLESCGWWLRSSGGETGNAAVVSGSGEIDPCGIRVTAGIQNEEKYGVRPVMRVIDPAAAEQAQRNAEPVKAESVKAEPVKAEPVKSEPAEAEPAEAMAEKVDSAKDKVQASLLRGLSLIPGLGAGKAAAHTAEEETAAIEEEALPITEEPAETEVLDEEAAARAEAEARARAEEEAARAEAEARARAEEEAARAEAEAAARAEEEAKARVRDRNLRVFGTEELQKGAFVFFGKYETGSGIRPIRWRVLEGGDSLLLITEEVIDCRRYNDKWGDVTWQTCTLRKWLNEQFLSAAFTDEERQYIAENEVPAHKNPEFSTDPGEATNDRVFLLSAAEAKQYFDFNEARLCHPTESAKSKGVYTDKDNYCWWWLRTSGSNNRNTATVNDDGIILCNGTYVNNDRSGIRPALWVDLSVGLEEETQ